MTFNLKQKTIAKHKRTYIKTKYKEAINPDYNYVLVDNKNKAKNRTRTTKRNKTISNAIKYQIKNLVMSIFLYLCICPKVI